MPDIFKGKGCWFCGFDFLPNGAVVAGGVFDQANGGNSVNATFARFSGKGIQFNGNNLNLGRSLSVNLQSCIVGFGFLAVTLPGSAPNSICTFYDATALAPQVTLAYNTSGQVGFYSTGGFPSNTGPGTLRGTLSAPGVIVPGAYNIVEILATIDPATGLLQCMVNQTLVTDFAGATRTTANSWSNRIYIGSMGNNGGGGNQYFDDMYILDLTAPAPLNTFLGNGRLQTDGPNADSLTAGLNQWAFTTPAGSDFANAANIPANPAQFNSDATVGHRMSFRYPAISAQKVLAINTWMSAQQDAASTRQVTPKYRSSNIDQVGDAVALSNGVYVFSNQPSIIDPNTGLPWASGTAAAASACEIGVEVTT